MKSLAILLALLIVAPSPALAVRKVEKKNKQQSAGVQAADQHQEQRQEGNVEKGEPSRAAGNRPEVIQPEREDKFIDENSDGINDKIDQRQTVKVKMKEKVRERPRESEPSKKDAAKTPDKKSRRDR